MQLEPREEATATTPQTRRGEGNDWLEMLRQWLVQCPQCFEIRLVVGAHEMDQYVCKDCGYSFVIGVHLRREPPAS